MRGQGTRIRPWCLSLRLTIWGSLRDGLVDITRIHRELMRNDELKEKGGGYLPSVVALSPMACRDVASGGAGPRCRRVIGALEAGRAAGWCRQGQQRAQSRPPDS